MSNVDEYPRCPSMKPYVYEVKEPPWAHLDPGIVDVVRMLWLAGFCPTDSGDGVSKAEAGRVLDVPHVFMVVRDYRDTIAETERLFELVSSRLGICVEPPHTSKVSIEASYDPSLGLGIIALIGVSNDSLPKELCW